MLCNHHHHLFRNPLTKANKPAPLNKVQILMYGAKNKCSGRGEVTNAYGISLSFSQKEANKDASESKFIGKQGEGNIRGVPGKLKYKIETLR